MAKAKNYSNYVELVGNVANIYSKSEKTGEMRFNLAFHRKYTKKDGTEVSETSYLPILVRPNRKWAKQDVVTKGAFLRVTGHLENNSYEVKDAEGKSFEPKQFKGGVEVNADKITVLKAREDGKVENTETGEVETIDEEPIELNA